MSHLPNSLKRLLFVRNIPWNATENDIKTAFSKYGPVQSCRLVLDYNTRKSRGMAYVEMEERDADNALSALDGRDFGGRILAVMRYDDQMNKKRFPSPFSFPPKMQRIFSRAFQTSSITLDKTLFVRNIAWSVNESDLAAAFAEHGDITSCRIITDRFTGRSRGFAFIEASDASSENIIAKMNGAEIGGREIIVAESDPAKKRPSREESSM